MHPFAGQHALITGVGSESGIGFATARSLVAQGATVTIVATSERVHRRAEELGGMSRGFVGDLTNEAAVAQLFASLDRLDIVVNNAGMTSVSHGPDTSALLEDLTLADWNEALARNLSTAFLVTRAALPVMKLASYGRIINVASTTGPLSAFVGGSGYAAAKAAMVGMTRALAVEVAHHGITVNAVAPGWINTGSATDAERRAGAASPVGRSGTADEVAAAVTFLASPSASYITGTMLVVDGGNAIAEDHS